MDIPLYHHACGEENYPFPYEVAHYPIVLSYHHFQTAIDIYIYDDKQRFP